MKSYTAAICWTYLNLPVFGPEAKQGIVNLRTPATFSGDSPPIEIYTAAVRRLVLR